MVQIEESDFRSLDEFPLKWRWTEPRWNVLPADALKAIRPFSDEKARELLQDSLAFSNEAGLIESNFDSLSSIVAPTDSMEVRQWLLERSTDKHQKVIVSWDHNHAALVRWDVFCEYWDDFCYPASDCVTVWPLYEEWALIYLKHEEFIFGVRRGSGAA